MNRLIGILGSGEVAKVLALGFQKHGHEVRIGSRTPEKLADWAAAAKVGSGTFAQVAQAADILVLAVKGTACLAALELAGASNLAGKVVIDTTNPIADTPPDHGVLRYFTGANESLMERLQATFPQARFVKAFNSVGNQYMVDPGFPDGRPTMFICGNDAAAKAEVATLLDRFGWDAEDVGMVESARPVEMLCQLWCAPGFLRQQWNHAYKVLKADTQA